MFIFVSDLHLVDHPSRASFRVPQFLETIRSMVRSSDCKQDAVTLILLGDIFEVLKSDVWETENVRPWSAPGDALSKATCRVLQGIYDRSPDFFSGLHELQQTYGVSLAYLPGNHDALIGDPDVSGARELLRSFLPGIPGEGDEPFPPTLVDEAHGVFAEHGHELDSFNSRSDRTGRFVPGDAVVIELLVRLPIEVAKESGAVTPLEAQFDKAYAFLHEMDNVDPQTLEGLLWWLEYQIRGDGNRAAMESAISAALRRCARNLSDAMKAHGATTLARRALRVLTSHDAFTKMPALRALATVPLAQPSEMPEVAKRVSVLAPRAHVWPGAPDLYVAGHTHVPLEQCFATDTGRRMVYLNSGTWRRVQSPALSHGRVIFHESYQESVLCVHRRAHAGEYGRYELRRYARGA